MDKIIKALKDKIRMGYSNYQLEVDYGYIGNENSEGYFISKLNGWGATSITDILAEASEINDDLLIEELDKMNIAHCLQ